MPGSFAIRQNCPVAATTSARTGNLIACCASHRQATMSQEIAAEEPVAAEFAQIAVKAEDPRKRPISAIVPAEATPMATGKTLPLTAKLVLAVPGCKGRTDISLDTLA